VKRGQKKIFKKNKVDYDKLADHIGQFPTVMISPYDADLIASGSEMRRKWLDGLISQFDRNYLDALMKYNAILAQRNALLKNAAKGGLFEPEAFDVWDEQMAQVGNVIYEKRKAFLETFTPVFQEYFTDISRSDETVGFTYLSQLEDADFGNMLQTSRSKDCAMGYSTTGIHKDDLIFELHGHPIKKVGSQGQQKSFLIALKLAQFHELTRVLGMKPVLLLDDIFDKLDNERVTRLMRLVSEQLFGQVLVTDTDAERVRSIFDAIEVPIRLFHVESGKIMQHEQQEIAR
jgi:DNA replication and repair protein RecF